MPTFAINPAGTAQLPKLNPEALSEVALEERIHDNTLWYPR